MEIKYITQHTVIWLNLFLTLCTNHFLPLRSICFHKILTWLSSNFISNLNFCISFIYITVPYHYSCLDFLTGFFVFTSETKTFLYPLMRHSLPSLLPLLDIHLHKYRNPYSSHNQYLQNRLCFSKLLLLDRISSTSNILHIYLYQG